MTHWVTQRLDSSLAVPREARVRASEQRGGTVRVIGAGTVGLGSLGAALDQPSPQPQLT